MDKDLTFFTFFMMLIGGVEVLTILLVILKLFGLVCIMWINIFTPILVIITPMLLFGILSTVLRYKE